MADGMPQHEYVQQTKERLDKIHTMLREQQKQVRQEDDDEPPSFTVGDLVLLENRRRRKRENAKLQARFVGPYKVVVSYPNHTYQIKKQGQVSV